MELLEIERELAGAEGASAMRRYDEMLFALQARAQEAINRGLPPEEYAKVADLVEVVTVARKLLRLKRQEPTPTNFRFFD